MGEGGGGTAVDSLSEITRASNGLGAIRPDATWPRALSADETESALLEPAARERRAEAAEALCDSSECLAWACEKRRKGREVGRSEVSSHAMRPHNEGQRSERHPTSHGRAEQKRSQAERRARETREDERHSHQQRLQQVPRLQIVGRVQASPGRAGLLEQKGGRGAGQLRAAAEGAGQGRGDGRVHLLAREGLVGEWWVIACGVQRGAEGCRGVSQMGRGEVRLVYIVGLKERKFA